MRSHKRATHLINFRSLIHEAKRYATHRTIFISFILEATQARYTSNDIIFVLQSKRRKKALKPLPSRRATLLYIYLVLRALKPLPSRRASLLYIYHVLQALRPLSSRRATLILLYSEYLLSYLLPVCFLQEWPFFQKYNLFQMIYREVKFDFIVIQIIICFRNYEFCSWMHTVILQYI